MRYRCWFCKKSVTSELPEESIIRAMLICPECIQAGRMVGAETPACVWTLRDDDEVYETACGQSFQTMEGIPIGEFIKFCSFCGRPMVVRSAAGAETKDK
jgi:hypothetical protein